MSSRKLISIFTVTIIILCIPGVIGSTIDLSGEPSYSLLIKTSNTQLNPKNNFTFDIFLSGLGNVDFSKLVVSISRDIVKGGKVNYTEIDYDDCTADPINNSKELCGKTISGPVDPSFWTPVSNDYYRTVKNKELQNEFSGKLVGAATIGELTYALKPDQPQRAPFSVSFVIADDAPPGDHNIEIVYTYGNKGKWFQDKQTIKIHVNRFYEKEWFHKITTLLAYLSIVVLSMQFIIGIKKFVNWLEDP